MSVYDYCMKKINAVVSVRRLRRTHELYRTGHAVDLQFFLHISKDFCNLQNVFRVYRQIPVADSIISLTTIYFHKEACIVNMFRNE